MTPTVQMTRLPGYLDRYPAKMVGRLAKSLIDRHCEGCSVLLDPFCGSGAVLQAAADAGFRYVGWDINPYATLLSGVKVSGFDLASSTRLAERCIEMASGSVAPRMPMKLAGVNYWFTKKTIEKYERLRSAFLSLGLVNSRDGRAVLLASALSVRRCSRADQRSPKPFVSRAAREARAGRHFDPYDELRAILAALGSVYDPPKRDSGRVVRRDARVASRAKAPSVSHVLTSPPYINAQDYYRNSKLELSLLEGIVDFDASNVQRSMIGTERGRATLPDVGDARASDRLEELVPGWSRLRQAKPRQAWVIARYVADMEQAFGTIDAQLKPGGRFILVCGDNLVGGLHVRTWKLLRGLLRIQRGYQQVALYRDRIKRRYVAPNRMGHKSIIKTEVVAVFEKPGR